MIITRDEVYNRVFDLWKAFMVTGISGAVAVPAVPCQAYPADDDGDQATAAPRPTRPYATIKVSSLPDRASGPAYGYNATTHTATYSSSQEFTVSIQTHGTGALNFLQVFLAYAVIPAWRQKLLALGLGYSGEAMAPRPATAQLETRFEPRATADLRFTALQTVTQSLLQVQEVEATLESKRRSAVLSQDRVTLP